MKTMETKQTTRKGLTETLSKVASTKKWREKAELKTSALSRESLTERSKGHRVTKKRLQKCSATFNESSAVAKKELSFSKPECLEKQKLNCKLFECVDCGKNYKNKSALTGHMRLHTGEFPHTRQLSRQGFTSPRRLFNHKPVHRRGETYSESSAVIKKEPISKPGDLQKQEVGYRRFDCFDCGESYKRKSALTGHMRLHTNEGPQTRQFCQKGLTLPGHFFNHERVHQKGKAFSESSAVIKKEPFSKPKRRRKQKYGERLFDCFDCGKTFKLKCTLIGHIRLHTGERPYTCQFCQKGFTLLGRLVNHELVHRRGKVFSCRRCKKSYTSSSSLARHKYAHTKKRPYACSVCGKGMVTKQELARHERVHTGERPFSCRICQKAFKDSGSRARHEHSHTGMRPHACDMCDKKFGNKYHLKRHRGLHKEHTRP